jgi:hypothetical protein
MHRRWDRHWYRPGEPIIERGVNRSPLPPPRLPTLAEALLRPFNTSAIALTRPDRSASLDACADRRVGLALLRLRYDVVDPDVLLLSVARWSRRRESFAHSGLTRHLSVSTEVAFVAPACCAALTVFRCYATAIPNRIGHSADEASSNYPQEFASTHDAGIALNNIMPHFVTALASF